MPNTTNQRVLKTPSTLVGVRSQLSCEPPNQILTIAENHAGYSVAKFVPNRIIIALSAQLPFPNIRIPPSIHVVHTTGTSAQQILRCLGDRCSLASSGFAATGTYAVSRLSREHQGTWLAVRDA